MCLGFAFSPHQSLDLAQHLTLFGVLVFVQDAELMELLKRKKHPVCYDGFEPSGRMHIAQGILKAINVRECLAYGGGAGWGVVCSTLCPSSLCVGAGEQADISRLCVQVLGCRLVCAVEQQDGR